MATTKKRFRSRHPPTNPLARARRRTCAPGRAQAKATWRRSSSPQAARPASGRRTSWVRLPTRRASRAGHRRDRDRGAFLVSGDSRRDGGSRHQGAARHAAQGQESFGAARPVGQLGSAVAGDESLTTVPFCRMSRCSTAAAAGFTSQVDSRTTPVQTSSSAHIDPSVERLLWSACSGRLRNRVVVALSAASRIPARTRARRTHQTARHTRSALSVVR